MGACVVRVLKFKRKCRCRFPEAAPAPRSFRALPLRRTWRARPSRQLAEREAATRGAQDGSAPLGAGRRTQADAEPGTGRPRGPHPAPPGDKRPGSGTARREGGPGPPALPPGPAGSREGGRARGQVRRHAPPPPLGTCRTPTGPAADPSPGSGSMTTAASGARGSQGPAPGARDPAGRATHPFPGLPAPALPSPAARRLRGTAGPHATPSAERSSRLAAQDGGHLRPLPGTPRPGSQQPLRARPRRTLAGASRRLLPPGVSHPRGPWGGSASYHPVLLRARSPSLPPPPHRAAQCSWSLPGPGLVSQPSSPRTEALTSRSSAQDLPSPAALP